MPVYDYLCDTCGPFTGRAPMSQASAPMDCPACAQSARRIVLAPQLNLMSPTRRMIDRRNEKSAHAPATVHRRAGGDECGHQGHQGHKHEHGAQGHKHAHAPNRPWMIGH